MATLQENTHQSKPKTHDFLSSYGLSQKISSRECLETMKSGHRRRVRFFSFFRLKERKSISGKTVPVEGAVAVVEEEDNNFHATSRKSTSKSKPQPLPEDKLQPTLSDLKPVASDQSLDEKDDITWSKHVRKAVLENGKSPQNSHSLKLRAYQTSESLGWRIEAVGTKKVISHPSLSMENIINHKLTRQSLSRPTLYTRPETNPTADDSSSKKNFGPKIGICILTLTLLITVLWGRLWAVICMSALFYILPRLSSSSESKNRIEERSQSLKITERNSDLYRKKKVVLEGFLERTGRSRLGISQPC